MAQCKARSKRTGKQCNKGAIPGGTVCKFHGGGAPQVRRKAAERLEDLIDPDRALREAAALAYSDLTTLFDDKGNLLPKEKWPEALRPAIRKIEVVRKNVTAGDGQTDDVLRVEAWDKVKALEMIAKHLGLFEDKVKHEGRIEIGWIK